jgi:calcineurin-like phosphoesterase family protein
MRWWTSDWHVGHVNIIGFCTRPFANVDAMDSALVAAWNHVVEPGDEVVVVGDFLMGRAETHDEFLARLAPCAAKTLVVGNHDRPYRKDGGLNDEKVAWWTDRGWEVVAGFTDLDVAGELVDVSHFPHPSGDGTIADKYARTRPAPSGRYLIHGHAHGTWRQNGLQIDVGVDAWGGRLVSDDDLAFLFDTGPGRRDPMPWVAAG